MIVYDGKFDTKGKDIKQIYNALDNFRLGIDYLVWYIDHYLNPEEDLITETDIEKILFDLGLFYFDEEYHTEEHIAEYIRAMDYDYFLQTPYWKYISKYKKQIAKNRCQLCNKKGVLHTHHRTYEIHGYELQNLDDLIVLCDKCHSSFHGKGGRK